MTDRPQPIERVAQLGGGSSRRARERTHGPDLLGRVGDQLTQRLGDEHGVARFGRRRPCVRCGWWGVAAGIEEAGDQIGAGHPVDHAMVHLRDERPLASSEAFDHPRLPQRPMPVELLRHQPPHQGVEIRFRAGRWQRGMADVVLEVEMRVVDPHRPAQPARHETHLLPVAGDHRQLARDQRDDLVVTGRRTFEDRARPDVHVGDPVLHVEEHAVERAHVVHRCSVSIGWIRPGVVAPGRSADRTFHAPRSRCRERLIPTLTGTGPKVTSERSRRSPTRGGVPHRRRRRAPAARARMAGCRKSRSRRCRWSCWRAS